MTLPNYLDFDSAWDYSHPDQTEIKFREILQQVHEDNPAHMELLTQIARTQGLQGRFEEAHQILDQVEKRIGDIPSRLKVRYLLERGRVLNSSGKPEDSCSCFEQALDSATQLAEDSYAIDAIHMLAIVSPPASGLGLNLRAIKLAESSDQEKARGWLGSLYNNAGWSYHDVGDYESALDMFQKAESARRSNGSVNEIRTAVWAVARALRSLKRVEEALSKQMALKAEFDQAGEVDGYVFEEIGECLLALNRAEEASAYFAHAHEVLSQDTWLAENEPARLRRLKELGAK